MKGNKGYARMEESEPHNSINTTDSSKEKWWAPLLWFTRGDVDAFASLCSNNMSSLLVCAASLEHQFGGTKLARDVVYGRIVPGVGISMLVGNIFYCFQAMFYANSTRRTDICAQPFGISTPSAFLFINSIIVPIYQQHSAAGADAAIELAWRVGVSACFVQGVVEIILAMAGPSIRRGIRMVALLTALSSIGLSFLAVNTIQGVASLPIVSWVCIFVVLSGYFGGVRFGSLPTSLVTLLIGTVLSWSVGHLKSADLKESVKEVGVRLPVFPLIDIFKHFKEVAPYMGLIVPAGLSTAIGTIQCCTIAAHVGDDYNVRWSMLGDGICTCLSAMLGGTFGMTVFIGHSAFKNMGAKVAYSWMNGVFMVLVCLTGITAVILDLFAVEGLKPILLFIGLIICADTLKITPKKHYPAFMLGLCPALCNWGISSATSLARRYAGNVDFTGVKEWAKDPSLYGLYLMGENYLLTSLILTSMMIYLIDRMFLHAALWSLFGATFSLFGFMHASQISVLVHKDDMGWRMSVGYLMVSAFFVILHVAQSLGYVTKPDPTPEPGEDQNNKRKFEELAIPPGDEDGQPAAH